MNKAEFMVSDKCVGCGKCTKVCPGGILFMGEDKRPHMKAFEEFGIGITDVQALDFQLVYADRQRHIHMSEQMDMILDYCSGKAELGIITNGPSEHQWNKVKSLRVERWIPHENIFVSRDVGAEKPDRKIFEYAERAMGLEKAEIWVVGDSYALDVKGAANVGWNAVWMNRRRRKKPEDNIAVYEEVHTEQELMAVLGDKVLIEAVV